MGRSTVEIDGKLRYVDELNDEEHTRFMMCIVQRMQRCWQDRINQDPEEFDRIANALKQQGGIVCDPVEADEVIRKLEAQGKRVYRLQKPDKDSKNQEIA